jgi:hypothetical protein
MEGRGQLLGLDTIAFGLIRFIIQYLSRETKSYFRSYGHQNPNKNETFRLSGYVDLSSQKYFS